MTNDWISTPHLRARDIDREYAIGQLRHAVGEGQLTQVEFDDRLRQAMHARTLGELAALVGDLRVLPDRTPRPQPIPISQPEPRRGGAGRVGLAAGLALALLVLASGLFTVVRGGESGGYEISEPEPAIGDFEANPLEQLGLDPEAKEALDRIELPGQLPIPEGTSFDGHNWQSADTDASSKLTTFRWHLEYLVPDTDEPLEPRHVADYYHIAADVRVFGLVPEKRALPDGEGIELSWAPPPSGPGNTLLVRARYTAKGSIRVLLDVTSERPAEPRADVAGELGSVLLGQQVAAVPGMAYLQSRVSQVASNPAQCTFEQVWFATPAQYAKVRTRASGANVEVVDVDGGKQLTFRTTAGCGPLAI
jgi:hypothetical protein